MLGGEEITVTTLSNAKELLVDCWVAPAAGA
jgi:hypothetical protein